MLCDYGIQHIYHLQQVAWNEQCYKQGLRIQEHNYQESLEIQQAHFKKQMEQSEKNHQETIVMQENHHIDNLELQKEHNNQGQTQQYLNTMGNIAAPVVSGVTYYFTGNETLAAAAYPATQAAFTTIGYVKFPSYKVLFRGKK